MSYIDIQNLTRGNIITGEDNRLWIKANRKKTGERISVPLLDIPLQILEKYGLEDKDIDEKLLPISSNQKMNEYLKEIASVCGINRRITYHVARHRNNSFLLKTSELQNSFYGQVTIKKRANCPISLCFA